MTRLTSDRNPRDWFIWFDLDDTLWDFKNNSEASLRTLYRHFQLDRYQPDVESWLDFYHEVNGRLWHDFALNKVSQKELRYRRFYVPLVHIGLDGATADRTAREADLFYLAELGRRDALVPGAKQLLDAVSAAGFRMGILSNGFSEVQYNKLRSGGIDHYFDTVVLSDEIDVNKPDIRIYGHAVRKAGADARRCIMIGDNLATDIEGAVNARWPVSVWFNREGVDTEGVSPVLFPGQEFYEVRSLDEIVV